MRRVTVYVSDEDWEVFEMLQKTGVNLSGFFRDAGLQQARKRSRGLKEFEGHIDSAVNEAIRRDNPMPALEEDRSEYANLLDNLRLTAAEAGAGWIAGNVAGADRPYEYLMKMRDSGDFYADGLREIVGDLCESEHGVTYVAGELYRIAEEAARVTVERLVASLAEHDED
ncbi:MAG TPA: hypothetical protein VJP78_09645 [Thermoleophilia bacterium]|nr:hypothetical protein [Thermoleophilia bacterium]